MPGVFVLVAPAAASVPARARASRQTARTGGAVRRRARNGCLEVCSGESVPLSRARPQRSRVRAPVPALAVVQQRPGLAPDPDVHVLCARGCAVCESETDAGSAKGSALGAFAGVRPWRKRSAWWCTKTRIVDIPGVAGLVASVAVES